MSAFSPVSAAVEGFRVLKREPKAVLVWVALWLALLVFMGAMVALVGRVAPSHAASLTSMKGLIGRWGPVAIPLALLFLFAWTVQTSATYRAVLEPEDNKWWFLRVGQDELRLSVVALVAFLVGLVIVPGASYVVWLLFNPFMQAAPTLARYIAQGGAVVTVLLLFWLGVRLSLIAVETLAENRFHMAAYWPLTRGHFWRLTWSYLLLFLLLLPLLAVWALLSGLLVQATTEQLIQARAGLDASGRVVVWGLVALTALDTAFPFVLMATTVSACQAYAFRAIYGTNYPQDRFKQPRSDGRSRARATP